MNPRRCHLVRRFPALGAESPQGNIDPSPPPPHRASGKKGNEPGTLKADAALPNTALAGASTRVLRTRRGSKDPGVGHPP